jgi:Zn-finger nucleic acid-binding protein
LTLEADGAGKAAGCDCPRCGERLQSRDYAEMSVEECDKCGGLFLAPPMVERLVSARDLPTGLRLALPRREVKRETTVRYIHCPVCRNLMNRQAFARISGVVIDVCKSHGLWFDGGELAEVTRFVEEGGLERAREREISELTECERRLRTERAIAAVNTDFRADLDDRAPAWTNGGAVLEELLRFIARVWR